MSVPKLDFLGRQIGQSISHEAQKSFTLFDKIIDRNAMGSFVIVSQALIHFLPNNFDKVMVKSREYIVKGNEWYVCDIFGERSLGQALVDYFDKALPWFKKFLEDENKWVKRSVGVAIHFFSKRILNEPEKTKKLLELIEPYIEERQIDVIKSIGWALKTIGKRYPEILVEFLKRQIKAKKVVSKLMVKKALTYLDKDKKLEIETYV
ncbi:MAG: DNA alkylation repair protein [Candidatus Bathyarchaeia archaeon]